ncbi:fimbrial protein [Klebsiella sp. I138]|uniref:fimbrial protein n=1 Tax=Klebsiella sp. I138 TaxID=2755385 RepID=UPI003DAA27DD
MRYRTFIALLPLLLGSTAYAETKLVGGDMHFHGTVMALACSLPPNADKIEVDFGQIAAKDLYLSGRSQPQKFTIPLRDCNPDVFATISVTFNGTENPSLPNHLALNSGGPGSASGVAIGLSEENGTAIRLGQSTSRQAITEGPMELHFLSWVEAEPDALKNQSIEFGPFSASGTWTLNYQ